MVDPGPALGEDRPRGWLLSRGLTVIARRVTALLPSDRSNGEWGCVEGDSMEERRFDDLTRRLGGATSRRQVLKGLLGGLGAALLSCVPATVDAAGGTCSSQQYETCVTDAKTTYDSLTAHCGTVDGPAWAGSICALAATAEYTRLLAHCHSEQCPAGMACVNDRCCLGANCCQQGEIHCPGVGTGIEGGTCCPAGSVCCEGGCCTPDKTCCLNFNLTFFNPSAKQVCTDLQTDANNCGACNHKCHGQPCVDGKCQPCPSGQSLCKGSFDQVCCNPQEQCQISGQGSAECVPICDTCETYDPTSQQCVPAIDGTSCGSGLVCCGSQCIDDCGSGQSLNLDTCTCECAPVSCPAGQVQDPNTCQCSACQQPPDCQPPLLWDSSNCHCQNTCTEVCEPNGYICCTNTGVQNSKGLYYCCESSATCCNSVSGCCYS